MHARVCVCVCVCACVCACVCVSESDITYMGSHTSCFITCDEITRTVRILVRFQLVLYISLTVECQRWELIPVKLLLTHYILIPNWPQSYGYNTCYLSFVKNSANPRRCIAMCWACKTSKQRSRSKRPIYTRSILTSTTNHYHYIILGGKSEH